MGFTQYEALLNLHWERGRVGASYSWLHDLDFAALCSSVLESCLSCALHLHTCVSGGISKLWGFASLPMGYFFSSLRWWQDFSLFGFISFISLWSGARTHVEVRRPLRVLVLLFHHMNDGDWKRGGKRFYPLWSHLDRPHLFGFERKGEPRFFLPLLTLTSAAFVRFAGVKGICIPQPWHHQPSVREGSAAWASFLHPTFSPASCHSLTHSMNPLTYGQYTVALMQTSLAQTQI